MQGQVNARQRGDLARPQAGGVDHMFGDNVAARGRHPPFALGQRCQRGDRGLLINLRPLAACGGGVNMRRAGRVQMAVQRVPQGAQDAVDIDEIGAFANLFGTDQMGVEPHMAMFGARRPQVIHPLRGGRQGHAADLVQATGQIAQRLQLAVEIDGIALQGGHVGIGVEGVECAGGVPRRAGGQFRPLQQNDIAPAEFG